MPRGASLWIKWVSVQAGLGAGRDGQSNGQQDGKNNCDPTQDLPYSPGTFAALVDAADRLQVVEADLALLDLLPLGVLEDEPVSGCFAQPSSQFLLVLQPYLD
jgi:hypothetical protein